MKTSASTATTFTKPGVQSQVAPSMFSRPIVESTTKNARMSANNESINQTFQPKDDDNRVINSLHTTLSDCTISPNVYGSSKPCKLKESSYKSNDQGFVPLKPLGNDSLLDKISKSTLSDNVS